MKSYSERSINDRLSAVKKATANAVKPEVAPTLSESGYNTAKVKAGKDLYNAANARTIDVAAKLGAQKNATTEAADADKAVRKAFQKLAKTARAVFIGNTGVLGQLGLDKPMPRKRSDLVTASRKLFNTTTYTGSMRSALAEHGYDDATLSSERAKIDELESAIERQALCKAALQQTSSAQKSALKAMDKWMAKFIKIARVALGDDPQWLEMFGVIARSGPTKAQREGRRKAAATRKEKKQLRVKVAEKKVA